MKKLTTKQKCRLESELSFNDMLYQHFRYLNEDLRRRELAFERRKQVIRVSELGPSGVWIAKQIVEYQRTPDGVVLVVR
jgi:hypothetical protein